MNDHALTCPICERRFDHIHLDQGGDQEGTT